MTRDEIAAVVVDAVNAEFAYKHDNDSIVNADWSEIRGAIAARVADKLAHLTLSETNRETLEDLRDSYCVTEDESILLTRLLGDHP